MNSHLIILLLIWKVSHVLSDLDFTANFICNGGGGQGNTMRSLDDVSIAMCNDDKTMVDCNFFGANGARPAGAKIVSTHYNDHCLSDVARAPAKTSNINWFNFALGHCCSFEEQTFDGGVVFKPTLSCTQYTSDESTTEDDAATTASCQLSDEYLMGCTAFTIKPDDRIRGYCPGTEKCSDIKYGSLINGKFEIHHGGGRFIGYRNLGNHCTAYNNNPYSADSTVFAQANCCQITGYDSNKFELKDSQCITAVQFTGNNPNEDISCPTGYTTTGVTAYSLDPQKTLIDGIRTDFGNTASGKDEIYISGAWAYGTANPSRDEYVEAYAICCKFIFTLKS